MRVTHGCTVTSAMKVSYQPKTLTHCHLFSAGFSWICKYSEQVDLTRNNPSNLKLNSASQTNALASLEGKTIITLQLAQSPAAEAAVKS